MDPVVRVIDTIFTSYRNVVAQVSGLVKVYLLMIFLQVGISPLVVTSEQRSKIRYNAADKENIDDTRCPETSSQ